MTYDLVVFSPLRKLRNRSKFLKWLEARTRWQDALDYDDPNHAPVALRSWYQDMIELFPARYGPRGVGQADEISTADYGIGQELIHVGFHPSRAELAYETVHRLAARHAVGLFDAHRGEAWFPGPRKTLEIAHEGPKAPGSQTPYVTASLCEELTASTPAPAPSSAPAPVSREAARLTNAAAMPAPDAP